MSSATGYLLLACPKCHAAYKIRRESADVEVACRTCGHRWVPSEMYRPAAEAQAAQAAVAATPAAKTAPHPPGEETPVGEAAPAHPALAPHEDVTDPLVGTQVDGFKILSRIGSGGFGVVYRAFDTNLERSIAIKMLPPDLTREHSSLVERFLREARSAAKLSHPNIVTIHQIVPYHNTFYIVMELVDGGALHEFLAIQKRFNPREATRIVRAAAEGLGHAHRRGIIHRDIKPGNIMMTNDGQVKVSDFGLARDVLQGRDIVGPGHSLGTPKYMAPEQALGEEPTAASDLYSLAATYYVLLTGRAPFDAQSDRQMMKKHVTAPVPDPRQSVPDLPVTLYRFLQKAMAKHPEERYHTAEDFIAALDRLDFSATDDDTAATPQLLSAQIGPISVEDRGSHLSEALGRAVRRARKGAALTPPEQALAFPGAPHKRALAGWKLWLLIGAAAALLIAAAAITAILISRMYPAEPGAPVITPGDKRSESPGPAETPKQPAITPGAERSKSPGPAQTPKLPIQTPKQPAETPKQPGQPPKQPAQPPKQPGETPKQPPMSDLLEKNAQEKLEQTIAFEKRPNVWLPDVIQAYQNIIDVFPTTKAAKEAEKAIERLQRGERLPPDAKPGG